MRAPFAPPRLSEPRKVEAEAHAVETSSETERPEARILLFERGDILRVDQRVIDRGNRILPDEFLRRNFRPEITRARTHVAVRQLEPGARKRVGELIRILQETPRDLLVNRVDPQRRGRWSTWKARSAWSGRARAARCRRRRRSSASTGARRRGSSSVPIRSRTGFRSSRCSTCVGVVVQVTSRPLVIASPPLPVPKLFFQPRPCASRPAASGSGPTLVAGAAPCVLPKLWPPAMSATVSSSFMAMRLKVSRISIAAAAGSGLPSGPSGLT